jgi:hypothetical protein
VTGNAYFTVPVRIQVPIGLYRPLAAASEKHGADIGELIVECARRVLAAGGNLHAETEPSRRLTQAPGPTKRTMHRWLPEHDEILRSMHAVGQSDLAIAHEIGCSAASIGNHRAALGLPPNFDGRRAIPRAQGAIRSA